MVAEPNRRIAGVAVAWELQPFAQIRPLRLGLKFAGQLQKMMLHHLCANIAAETKELIWAMMVGHQAEAVEHLLAAVLRVRACACLMAIHGEEDQTPWHSATASLWLECRRCKLQEAVVAAWKLFCHGGSCGMPCPPQI
jgi:hypothetical protein